jgi:hypothetical protein
MKTFSQLVTELKEFIKPTEEQVPDGIDSEGDGGSIGITEQTVHLAPHGGKGTHFKVVKGIPGQLEKGEVIHDSHIDDLHDVGIKTKILKEEELSDEDRAILEAEDVTELPFDDGEGLEESWMDPRPAATKPARKARETRGKGLGPKAQEEFDKRIADAQIKESSHPDVEAEGRRLAAQDTPDTEAEEKEIARGNGIPRYKGHAAAMRKKHGIKLGSTTSRISPP